MTQLREDFAIPAPEETLQRVAERMRERNIEVAASASRRVSLAPTPTRLAR